MIFCFVFLAGKRAWFIEGQCPNLLGRDWLLKIKMNWQDVFRVDAIKWTPSVRNIVTFPA